LIAQEVLDALLAHGATAEMIVAAVKADNAKTEQAIEDRRAKDRERQRRHRLSRDVTVTPRDERDGFPNESNLTLPEDAQQLDEASASSPVRQPIAEAKHIWNEAARTAGWPLIQTMSPTRERSLAARLRQHTIDGWRAAINRARASPYLAGADPPSWFTFNWLIKAENFLKLSEGNYDRNRSSSQPKSSGWESAYHANMGVSGHG
jgi:hypothetical protein